MQLDLYVDDEPKSQSLQPVEILHVREHPFKKRDKRGCDTCQGPKASMLHVGAPPSLNIIGATGSGNRFVYQAVKHAWQSRLIELMKEEGLPTGLSKVMAEGQVCFPDRTKRDCGNYRYILEKALGDALVEGGWLKDDSWDFYSFGGLEYTYQKGVSWTRLMLFPQA